MICCTRQMLVGCKRSAHPLQQQSVIDVRSRAQSSPITSGIQGKWFCSPPCARCAAVGVNCCRCLALPGCMRSAQSMRPWHTAALGSQAQSSLCASQIEGKKCCSLPCARRAAVGVICCGRQYCPARRRARAPCSSRNRMRSMYRPKAACMRVETRANGVTAYSALALELWA